MSTLFNQFLCSQSNQSSLHTNNYIIDSVQEHSSETCFIEKKCEESVMLFVT